MEYLRPRFINSGGLHGEFTIDDYGIFLGIDELNHVRDFWEATVAQCLILDHAHDQEISKITVSNPPADPELMTLLEERKNILSISDKFLIKTNIFSLVSAFFEYGMLEVYKLVFGGSPTAVRPDLVRDILEPLKEIGVVGEAPDNYDAHVLAHRNPIRNAFAHGRWGDLDDATKDVDLHDAFLGTIAYFSETEDRLLRHLAENN